MFVLGTKEIMVHRIPILSLDILTSMWKGAAHLEINTLILVLEI